MRCAIALMSFALMSFLAIVSQADARSFRVPKEAAAPAMPLSYVLLPLPDECAGAAPLSARNLRY